jgi:uncharacterized protein
MSSEKKIEIGLGGLRADDVKTIIDILQQHSLVEEALLFGSRAKGNYKNGSDVDIALKGENIDWDTISHVSYLLNEETIMPYKFDVLNYHETDKSLVEHIDRAGIVFFKQQKVPIEKHTTHM